jgi:hypothetical protein
VFYGLDLQELETFRERVNAVKPDDIQRVAKQYLRPDRLSIVLVGDASIFAKQLPGAGFEQFERIPLANLDLAAADFLRPATPPGGLESPIQQETEVPGAQLRPVAYQTPAPGRGAGDPSARDLIDRAVEAKGGAARLRSVRTVRAAATMTITMPASAPVDLQTVTSIRYPGSFRMEARTPTGSLVQVFHNGEFWVRDARGAREAPASVADEMRNNVQRDAIGLLLGLLDRKVTASRIPDVQIEGRAMPAIHVQGPAMERMTVVFDPSTALIVRQRYRAILQGTSSADMEEEYSDFRDVSGLQVPFAATVRVAGAIAVRRVLHTVEYNVPLDPSLFSRPS